MKIGIWGYGAVGQSATKYFLNKSKHKIEVIDKKAFSKEEKIFFKKNKIRYSNQENISEFFQKNEKILISPGIDALEYKDKFREKIISELDIFYTEWRKKIIAITGSLGKTSIVSLLSKIFEKTQYKAIYGGNIGNPMLNLISLQEKYDVAILEVSSFQLEYCNKFAPDLAIWTNFYPNHLDKHKTIENYFNAKFKILTNQKKDQEAFIPLDIYKIIKKNEQFNNRSLNVFTTKKTISKLDSNNSFYTIEDKKIIKINNQKKHILNNLNNIPDITFDENLLILNAICDKLNIPFNKSSLNKETIPSHRLNLIDTINGVNFYNDSKSTITESTIAAIKKLDSKKIHLFIGGISKGVDRTQLLRKVTSKVKTVYCFGSESEILHKAFQENKIKSFKFNLLQEAFNHCINNSKIGDIILFSPAGASFDQFKNFEERGNYFIDLVKKIGKI